MTTAIFGNSIATLCQKQKPIKNKTIFNHDSTNRNGKEWRWQHVTLNKPDKISHLQIVVDQLTLKKKKEVEQRMRKGDIIGLQHRPDIPISGKSNTQ